MISGGRLTALWFKCQRMSWDGPTAWLPWPRPALKTLQAENEEPAVCHSLTEREVTSRSLETRMLRAALEQNGLQLETHARPSSRQCQLHWVSKGPVPEPQKLTLRTRGQWVRKQICGQIFQTQNWDLYLKG